MLYEKWLLLLLLLSFCNSEMVLGVFVLPPVIVTVVHISDAMSQSP